MNLIQMQLVCMGCAVTSVLNCHQNSSEIIHLQQIGSKGESKLTEWIQGNTRPWMKGFNKSSTSFANSCGRSEIWWKIRPNGAVQGDFIWRDIQLPKGKTNLLRGIYKG